MRFTTDETEILDRCVDAFAEAMKLKLRQKADEGSYGWDDDGWPVSDIVNALDDHVKKGDFVDVANFAMFAWNRGGEER